MSKISKAYAFISYSSTNQQQAEALRVYFAEQGIRCWMAPYDIPAGSSYAAEIVGAIKRCGCMVLLLTAASQDSQNVRRELEIAVSSQIPIIPMQLEDLRLSSEFQYYLGTQQIVAVPAIDASSPSFLKAVEGVRHFLSVEPKFPKAGDWETEHQKAAVREPELPDVKKLPLWQRLRKEKWLLPGAAVLLVCLLIVLLTSGRGKSPVPEAETKATVAAIETVEQTSEETAATEETVMEAENLPSKLETEETQHNPETALEWYQKAAELGDSEAMYRLGVAFFNGKGTEQNYNTAMEWFQKAAALGNADASVWIGYLYDCGFGVEQNHQTALEWYQKAAEAGNASAMLYIGNFYKNGTVVEQNYQTALAWYQKAADKGDTTAMRNIGAMYEKGTGVEQSDKTALEWYQKAAEMGNALCMVTVGNFYANGKGVEKNVETALQWYLMAAEKGEVIGMGNAGWAYAYGLGEKADYEKAMEWYQKAADIGDSGAMKQIGALYEYGRGVEQNYQTAMEWYQKAAELGNADAMKAIARLKENGHA